MSSPGPILDYASPRPRGKLRLPAKSMLDWDIYPDGDGHCTTIVETLAGREAAVAGLIFGAFTFVVVSGVTIAQIHYARRHTEMWFTVAVLVLLAVAELVLMLMIIDQTWAKTTLRVTSEKLSFASKSPLRGRAHEWHTREIREVRLQTTQDQPDAFRLAKIEIVPDEPPSLELFVDHLQRDLEPVAQAIMYALGRIETPPLKLDEKIRRPSDTPVAQPDEQTFNRLVNLHRNLRGGSSSRE